jgi:hypothetical protein
MTRQLFLTFIFIFIVWNAIGQNCSCISGTKDKKTGTETKGGITNSKDFYSLLIQKETNYKDTTVAPKYYLFLNAASRVVLSDSTVKSKGTFELLLHDSSKVIFNDATCFNNQQSFGFSVGFTVWVTKEQLEIISKNPIVTLTAFGILTTSFKEKKQKEQQTIATCLLSEK